MGVMASIAVKNKASISAMCTKKGTQHESIDIVRRGAVYCT